MTRLPNILSIFRLCCAAVFPWVSYDRWWLIFVVAGFTEWADGYVARKFDGESKIGQILDPVADKFFFLVVVLMFFDRSLMTACEIALLSLRDIAVLSGVLWYGLRGEWGRYERMNPQFSGKFATGVQYGFFMSVVIFDKVVPALFYATVALGIWAAGSYIYRFIQTRHSIEN